MLQIDDKRIASDLSEVAVNIVTNQSKEVIKNDFYWFEVLNDIFFNIYQLEFELNSCCFDYENCNKIFSKFENRNKKIFIDTINSNKKMIKKVYLSYTNILKKYNPSQSISVNEFESYSERDFIDLVLSFFSTYGNQMYNIAKKYFVEKRIEMNYGGFFTENEVPRKPLNKEEQELFDCFWDYLSDLSQIITILLHINESDIHVENKTISIEVINNVTKKLIESTSQKIIDYLKENGFEDVKITADIKSDNLSASGEFCGLPGIESGYITSIYNAYNIFSASILIHELGHAIDFESFQCKQSKKIPAYPDYLGEVPSMTFESAFPDYLIKNKIDEKNAYLLYWSNLVTTNRYVEEGLKMLKKDFSKIDFSGCITENKESINFRHDILYGLGGFFSLHFKYIKDHNPDEFNRLFYYFISSRKEASLEDMINRIGFDVDEFSSGKIIEPDIKNHLLKLKRNFHL